MRKKRVLKKKTKRIGTQNSQKVENAKIEKKKRKPWRQINFSRKLSSMKAYPLVQKDNKNLSLQEK